MPAAKMHDEELETDASLVGRLLVAQFPHWADLPVEPVQSSGTDNAIYRLGDDMAVRLPRIHWATEQPELEHRWLPRLAPQLPLAIPIPLALGAPGEGYPWRWSIHRWLGGETATLERVADPASFAEQLAEFVTALQRVDATGGPPAGRGVPLAMRDAPTRAAIEELHGMVDTDAMTVVWDAALRVPEWNGPGVWIHGDLAPGNLLVVAGRLSAIIDFGCLGVGDPACDSIVAWNLLTAGTRNAYRAALRVDDDTWDRGRGWALSVALIQLPYYETRSPVLAAGARYTLNEVLADHASQKR
jgi:aminoglycoside phosphotransferase (APT) family kinase protein